MKFAGYIQDSRKFCTEPFLMVDVGASGGIDPKWRIFYDDFFAFGFDPLVKECRRLNKLENKSLCKYIAAFVGAPHGYNFQSDWQAKCGLMPRLSATLANKRLNINANERYNTFQDLVISKKYITLDDFFKKTELRLDFLKIDTDGHDIEVLYGAKELFNKKNFLGACIECQFHGPAHIHANTFANIDIFMRQRGFSLYDMQIHRYSRKDLPGKFLISIPAQTDIGQVQWADVLYFRDLSNPDYSALWGGVWTNVQLLKLACLFEIHNLNDCAIELLNVHQHNLSNIINVNKAITKLVPPIEGHSATINDYYNRFERSIEIMRIIKEGNVIHFNDKQKIMLKKSKSIYFFGAGGRLKASLPQLLALFEWNVKVKIADNDKSKWGTTYKKIAIVSPNEIVLEHPDIVIIVSAYSHEILQQLIDMKIQHKLNCQILTF